MGISFSCGQGINKVGAVLNESHSADSILPVAVPLGLPGEIKEISKEDFRPVIVRTKGDLRNALDQGKSLVNADFSRANLNDVNFSRLNLRGAKFVGANLERSVFLGADVRDADFLGAKMIDVKMMPAKTEGANFQGVTI